LLFSVLVVEVVERVGGLRLVVVPASDGRHEEIARLREAAELVHVAEEIIREKRERVVVGEPEGSAGVDADEERRPLRLVVLGLGGRDDDGAQEGGRDQARHDRDAQAAHSVACFRGRCKVCRMSHVCVISLPSLNGSENTWREATRTMPKLRTAAAICKTGRTR